MLETVFRTEDLPAADRFDCWYQMIRGAILPAIIQADRVDDFRATTRMLDLGVVQVFAISVPQVRVSRPRKLVRQSDPEQCHLVLNLGGIYGFDQGDRCTALGADDLMFYDSSRPFDGWTAPDGNEPAAGGQTHLQVQFPRGMLPNPALIDRHIGERLAAGGTGVRTLLAGYLRQLVDPSAQYRGVDSAGLATVTMDLITTLLAHESDAVRSLAPETRDRGLLVRIYDFMRHRLGDPALSPDMIAAAHHISTRYLHKLFQGEGPTVAAWIRQHRLEGCHRDLADPRHQTRPIHAIAARWGFTDKAHFSRLFRGTYGISASDYRQLARQAHIVRAPSTAAPASSTTA
jgi:AraC-like DNA-binding protein